MKRSMILVAFCVAAFAPMAGAYEYPLQFTPNPGARGLVVAGYLFAGNSVVGNCSYYTVSGHSGKGGGGGAVGKSYEQTCTWDLFGNLLSVTSGAPAAPAPLSINGTQVVYADDGKGHSTGTDTQVASRGFVNTPGSHYIWVTPNNNYAILQRLANTLVAVLQSDGDTPVNIAAVAASAGQGSAAVQSTTCIGPIDIGATCSITVTYDTTNVTSPTGLAYDTLRIDLTSDAGEAHDFIQKYTIIVTP